ncbi:MAG: NUDIX domain-containing protein [Nitrospinae bacterium]|jgi:isopentenyl-diphosphate Delta-isomerase|nr:NUDIX domain-containing protein [Nitrospinota bacterium]MDA1108323.1 NUDIX domain-containing protein [Nitrospinota bacterium]
MNSDEEIYDLVDIDDRVIGQATRKEIHKKNLLHRSVHIFVFNPEGDLYLQKRAFSKDENPGFWDTSCAGHVDAGENYLTAANRELMEELTISEPLHLFMKIKACKESYWEHVFAYTCTTRQPIKINPTEILEGYYWSLDEINLALSKKKYQFTSTFKILFINYLKDRG